MDIWDEFEVTVNSDNDAPVIKTSNKVGVLCLSILKLNECSLNVEISWSSVFQEITTILKELMRVQRQLESESSQPDPAINNTS